LSRPLRRRRGPWKRPPLWLAAAAGALIFAGWLDSRTQPDVDLSLFYAAVVAGAGWWLGRRYAAIAAVLAAVSWTLADLGRRPPSDARFAVWNGLTRLALFLFIGLAVARVHADRRRLRRSRRVLEEEILRARTDLPTELSNARGFLERIDRDLADPQRRGLSFALASIGIDGFRRYRDEHAVSAGEALAKRITGVLRKAIRASDTPARLARDEFAVAFWDVEREVVEKTLRRVISGIAALAADDPEARVSAAVGVAFFPTAPDEPQEALRQSEKALHLARDSGRGTLYVWVDEDGKRPAAAAAGESEPNR
jgi:diguanylate cyclase (GGDEF)-like protein